MEIYADDLPRFMQCRGSRAMPEAFPYVPNVTNTREEGTAIHYMISAVFHQQYRDAFELVDRKAPNGVYMSIEMAEHADFYLSCLKSAADYVWRGVEVDTSHSGIQARCDHIGHTHDGIIRADDFKYGWGIIEPEWNWTMISHVIGYALKTGIDWHKAIITIHQPRPHHPLGKVREWHVGRDVILQLQAQLIAAMNDSSVDLRTGIECVRCPANANCWASTKAGLNALVAFDTAFSDDMNGNQLAYLLDIFSTGYKQMEAKVKALEELVKHRVSNGKPTGDYHVEPSLGNRRWIEGLTVEALEAATGKKLAVPKLPTPKQAENAGVSEAIIKAITYRPPTGIKLVREDQQKRAARLLGKPNQEK